MTTKTLCDPDLDAVPRTSPIRDDGLPFVPLLAEGMPLPGPDFIEAAVALGDPRPNIVGKGDEKRMTQHGCWLTHLYRSALYSPDFSINVLVKGRRTLACFVPGHIWGGNVYGPRPARVMLLGKWPGMDEIREGRNMVGPSGKLLIQALNDVGVLYDDYTRWYVTNVIKHPQLDHSTSRPSVNQIRNCLPLLEQELRLVRPDFILTMGAEATEALFGEKVSVSAAQGRVMSRLINTDKGVHEARVMTCLHPAAIVRSPERYPEFLNSIRKFSEMLAGTVGVEQIDEVDHRVVWSERELKHIVDEILAEDDNGNIAIDCEWHGEYPGEPGAWLRTIQFSHKPGFACCVVLRHQGGEPAFLPSIAAAVVQLKRLMVSTQSRPVRPIGHNFRADLPWIMNGLDRELGQALLRQFDAPATPEETRNAGGFDTMLAAHAVNETSDFKLEVLALNVCNVQRYDGKLLRWKTSYCKERRISEKDLEGYGECPDEILHPYANWDVDAIQRLFRRFNNELLDCDAYQGSCRKPFWIAQQASKGFLEMEMTGVFVDQKRAEMLAAAFMEARSNLTIKLREMLRWPGFNPYSAQQCRVALFGPAYSGKIDRKSGNTVDIRPEGAISLMLEPVKTSGKPSQNWKKVKDRGQAHLYNPSTDKEVLGILAMRLYGARGYDEVTTLRNIRFSGQVLKSVLCPPRMKDDGSGLELDEDGDQIFEKGMMSWVMSDRRVRTHFFQTKETGRASSTRPPLQNLSKRREKDYKKILGSAYKYPLRSIISATPGWVLVEADYRGAELMMMAIQSADETMIRHCQLANLPDGHPEQYDIHSNMAVKAFGLRVPDLKDRKSGRHVSELLGRDVGEPLPPTRFALEICGFDNLRTAAKTIMFGIPYGRGNEAVIRAVEEEGVKIEIADAIKIREAIFSTYRNLERYFAECQIRPYREGFIVNCFGRRRRFPRIPYLQDGGAMGREAGNFPIQSGVADALSLGLHHLCTWPEREDRFRILLQIHDALLFEVRPQWLEWFTDIVLPECLTRRVTIHQCDLDGVVIPNSQTFHMETDVSVMLNWGEKLSREAGRNAGIPERFLPTVA